MTRRSPCTTCHGKRQIVTYAQISSDVRPIVPQPCPDCAHEPALTKHIIHDRVTERLRIDVEGGFVRILREYQIMPEGTWTVDPEAGVTFGREHLADVRAALAGLDKSR